MSRLHEKNYHRWRQKHIYVYIYLFYCKKYLCVFVCNNNMKKEAMNLKEQEGYKEGFGRRKGKWKECNYIINLKINNFKVLHHNVKK